MLTQGEQYNKDNADLLDKIRKGSPDVDKAKAKRDESIKKTMDKAEDVMKSMPMTSQDLGKTPTNAAKEGIKKVGKGLLDDLKDLLGLSSLDPTFDLITLHPPVLTDRDDTGALFTQAYVDAQGAPFILTNPGGVGIAGFLEIDAVASFGGPAPVSEFESLFGVPNDINPLLVDAYASGGPLTPNLEFFGPGEPASSWILYNFAKNADGTPAFDANGQINTSVQVFIVSDATMVPEPTSFALAALASTIVCGFVRRRTIARQ